MITSGKVLFISEHFSCSEKSSNLTYLISQYLPPFRNLRKIIYHGEHLSPQISLLTELDFTYTPTKNFRPCLRRPVDRPYWQTSPCIYLPFFIPSHFLFPVALLSSISCRYLNMIRAFYKTLNKPKVTRVAVQIFPHGTAVNLSRIRPTKSSLFLVFFSASTPSSPIDESLREKNE